MKTYKYILIFIIILSVLTMIFPVKTFAADSIDNVIKGADSFIEKGNNTTIDTTELQNASNFIYNTFLGIALIAAVAIGMILGIQYMMADSENKAKIKETLVPYGIAVVIVFGAFTIWKIVINVLS